MRVNNGLQRKASKPTSAEPARYDTKESCTVIAQRLCLSSLAPAGRCNGERDWRKGTILNLSRTRRAFYNFMTVPSAIWALFSQNSKNRDKKSILLHAPIDEPIQPFIHQSNSRFSETVASKFIIFIMVPYRLNMINSQN